MKDSRGGIMHSTTGLSLSNQAFKLAWKSREKMKYGKVGKWEMWPKLEAEGNIFT